MKINESEVACVPTSTPADSVPQLTATDCTACGDSWEWFLRDYSHWFGARRKEDLVVYACPVEMADHRLKSLFQLGDEAMAAEQAYSRLCKKCHAVAIHEHQPLVYRWFEPRIASSEEHWLQDMKTHGWTNEHIRQMNELVGKSNDIAERLTGSLGRLVCSPAFCAERESLRRQWGALPSPCRPHLPLYRSIRASRAIDGLDEVKLTQEQIDFAKMFDRFCDTWRINGMISWDLPEVDGPKWPKSELESDQQLLGCTTIDTPWHFCLLAEDGLGDLLRQEHERSAELKGMKDLKHWGTYGRLFQIDFWEQVINRRYLKLPKGRGFVTAINAYIAEIVGLDIERVQKLRKLRSALQRGKRSSLAGQR